MRGLREDYVIFRKKPHATDPVLSDADGPSLGMRRWLSRFDPPGDVARARGQVRSSTDP